MANLNQSLYEDATFRPPDEGAEELLRAVAKKSGAPVTLLQSMLDLENDKVHLSKRRNVKDQLRLAVEDHLSRHPRK